jgi:hypothetical protein
LKIRNIRFSVLTAARNFFLRRALVFGGERDFRASCSVTLERFTAGRLSYIPGIVKLWESPGRAGGLPRRIKKEVIT